MLTALAGVSPSVSVVVQRYAVYIIVSIANFRAMARSKVTAKYQITIPKEVRNHIPFRPGEIVEIEGGEAGTLLVRRLATVKEPLRILIGRRPSKRHIPVEELEEAAESR